MTEYWNHEQPLDLRVKTTTKRENKPYERDNVTIESVNKRNCILATLLKQPSTSKSNTGYSSSSKSREHYFSNNVTSSYEKNSSSYFTVPQKPEDIQCSATRHLSSSVSIHQNTFHKDNYKIDFKRNHLKQEIDTDEITIVFDSYRDLGNGLNKNCNDQSTSDSTSSGFVPNYRKFYARCHSIQSFNSRSSNHSNENQPTFNQSEFAFSNFPERRNEMGYLNSVQYQSRHLNMQHQNVPLIKLENDIETCNLEDSTEIYRREKDRILKCLLTNAVNDKIYLYNNYILQNSMYDNKLQFSGSDVFLKFRHPQMKLKQQPCHIYCPEAIRAVQKDSILKSLLVTNRPKPDPSQRSSGSYSAGSPGSESTSSGSTDSGVFSDILPDERRRIARGPSNRYIKTGTGASLETLKILRQVIMDRQQRTDREL